MNVSYSELRRLKHALPTGSVARMAQDLDLEEQTIRQYFGADGFSTSGNHLQPGPDGGVVQLRDPRIYHAARRILRNALRR